MRQFTKFVNFKAHTGLPKNQPGSSPVQVQDTPAPSPMELLLLHMNRPEPKPQVVDASELTWANEPTREIDECAQSGRSASWFASPFTNRQPEVKEEPQAISGRISFQGLTAVSETADKLEALLCSKPEAKTDAVEPDEPLCLNDIFWDLKLSNESIHRW